MNFSDNSDLFWGFFHQHLRCMHLLKRLHIETFEWVSTTCDSAVSLLWLSTPKNCYCNRCNITTRMLLLLLLFCLHKHKVSALSFSFHFSVLLSHALHLHVTARFSHLFTISTDFAFSLSLCLSRLVCVSCTISISIVQWRAFTSITLSLIQRISHYIFVRIMLAYNTAWWLCMLFVHSILSFALFLINSLARWL